LAGVGEVLAAQHLAGGVQAGIDQRLASGVGAGGTGAKRGKGQGGRSPRKDGSAIERHSSAPWARGQRRGSALAATAGPMIARFGAEVGPPPPPPPATSPPMWGGPGGGPLFPSP